MELILTENCTSYTGSVGRGFGYYIRRSRANRFFGQRSKGTVPHDGHLRFILACAEIAKRKLHIADIRVSGEELQSACQEAQRFVAATRVHSRTYNAEDIINFKTTFGL